MEQMRSEFEAWIKFHSDEDEVEGKLEKANSGANYADSTTDICWMAWQASRADIEIEAPAFIDSREALAKGFTVDYSNGFGDGMDAYEASIRAAGLRVKEK